MFKIPDLSFKEESRHVLEVLAVGLEFLGGDRIVAFAT